MNKVVLIVSIVVMVPWQLFAQDIERICSDNNPSYTSIVHQLDSVQNDPVNDPNYPDNFTCIFVERVLGKSSAKGFYVASAKGSHGGPHVLFVINENDSIEFPSDYNYITLSDSPAFYP